MQEVSVLARRVAGTVLGSIHELQVQLAKPNVALIIVESSRDLSRQHPSEGFGRPALAFDLMQAGGVDRVGCSEEEARQAVPAFVWTTEIHTQRTRLWDFPAARYK